MQKKFWSRTPVLFTMAIIATFLWGSAFPCIKIGYGLFGISASDTASQIYFAGIRFTVAGVLVIAITSIMQGKFAGISLSCLKPVVILALFQTIGQYFFFYIGLAHASGVSSSLIEATNTFLSVLFAAAIFRTEKISTKKILGCLIGFAGVALIEIPSSGASFGFSFLGEGFVLISTIMSAVSACYIKVAGQNENPMVLSGYQFLSGGVTLMSGGYICGGRLETGKSGVYALISSLPVTGVMLIIYMSFISACAYTLWSMLLKYNPVSRVAVFGFINPLVGVILSAILLGEVNQAFSLAGLVSLVLVSTGIVIVNR